MRTSASAATATATAATAVPLLPYQVDDDGNDNRHDDGADEQIAPVCA
jgi:hypothetical protein